MARKGEDLFEKQTLDPRATAQAAGVGNREGRIGLGAALAGFRARRDAKRRRRYEELTSEEARSASTRFQAARTFGATGSFQNGPGDFGGGW